MATQDKILALLAQHAGVETIDRNDALFGGGINLTSVAYTEFMLALEEEFNTDLELDGMDENIETVGQFVDFLAGLLPAD